MQTTKNQVVNQLNQLLSLDKKDISEVILEILADKIISIVEVYGTEEIDIKPLLSEEALKIYSVEPDNGERSTTKFGTREINCQCLGMTSVSNLIDSNFEFSKEPKQQAIEKVAKIFNFLVEKKIVIGIMSCICIKLAQISPAKRDMILLYIYTDWSMKDLNRLLRANAFIPEGALPHDSDSINPVLEN